MDAETYSVDEFCRAHRICRATFYNIPEDSRPKTYMVGKRRFISREAAAEWRRKLEAGEIRADVKQRTKALADTEAA